MRIGRVRDAGAVVVAYGGPRGLDFGRSQLWSQGTPEDQGRPVPRRLLRRRRSANHRHRPRDAARPPHPHQLRPGAGRTQGTARSSPPTSCSAADAASRPAISAGAPHSPTAPSRPSTPCVDVTAQHPRLRKPTLPRAHCASGREQDYRGSARVRQLPQSPRTAGDLLGGRAAMMGAMTTDDRSATQLQTIVWLHQLFSEHDIDYWLFGGCGGRLPRRSCDTGPRGRGCRCLARRPRPHTGATRGAGVGPRPDLGEDGYTGYERRGIRLELAFLVCDDAGTPYTPLAQGRGDWPSGSFGDTAAGGWTWV